MVHTVKELKSLAKTKGLKGYSTMKKAELEKALGMKSSPKKPKVKKTEKKNSPGKKVTPKEKGKMNKPKKSLASKMLSATLASETLKSLKEANKVRKAALQTFWDANREYLNEIADATEMSTQTEIVGYLHGDPLRVAGKTHRLPKSVISDALFNAVIDLISSTDNL